MSKNKDEFVFNGYGCPNTEMWMRRAAFEEAHPDLSLFMKKDAPHYASKATRIAYSVWEAEHEAWMKQLREEVALLLECFDGDEPELDGLRAALAESDK